MLTARPCSTPARAGIWLRGAPRLIAALPFNIIGAVDFPANDSASYTGDVQLLGPFEVPPGKQWVVTSNVREVHVAGFHPVTVRNWWVSAYPGAAGVWPGAAWNFFPPDPWNGMTFRGHIAAFNHDSAPRNNVALAVRGVALILEIDYP